MSRKNRKRKLGAEDRAVFEWEKDRILPENLRDEMETMWEIPQIYHFLQLTKEALNISHLSMYEVERMLLMPKASKQLAHIMTCLLSSPTTTKAKLQRVPPMPYEFWTNILTYKLKSWFKIYQTKRQDAVKVFDALGIEPEFWKVFSDASEIEGKDFQDFSFKQRVWLLKTVCDTAMHSRKTIQEEIAKQAPESLLETVLGIDRYGTRYIYFPQFLHNDLRVYKHCLDNKVLSSVKPPAKEVKPQVEAEVESKEEPKAVPRLIKKKKRKSRWSNGSLPQRKKDKRKTGITLIDQSVVDSNSNSVDGNFSQNSRSTSEINNISTLKTMNEPSDVISEKNKDVSKLMEDLKAQIKEDVNLSNKKIEESMAIDEEDNKEALVTPKVEDSKEDNLVPVDDLSKNSKTDDEKLKEMSSKNALKTTEQPGETDVQTAGATKDVNISKSDDEKLSETKKCDNAEDDESFHNDVSLDKWADLKKKEDENCSDSDSVHSSGTRRSARIRRISEIKCEVEDAENMANVCESEELCSIDLRDSICRVSSPEMEIDWSNPDFSESESKIEDFNEFISDLSFSSFQLVADSLDSLKYLTEYIFSDKSLPSSDAKKEDFVRPTCEEKLLKRLRLLCESLEKVESILKESTKKARCKLQREWNNFENGVMEEEQSPEAANYWVLGPQGCPVATPPTSALPHPAVPSVSTAPEHDTDEIAPDAQADSAQASAKAAQKAAERRASAGSKAGDASESGDAVCKKEEGTTEEDRGARRDGSEEEKDEDEDDSRKTTRVLRARGISSYTEQLLSDEESEEDELDGWADIEAIYAPPSAQSSAPTSDSAQKGRDSYDSEEEDSDQDWILPSSRKRKIKRQSASRRLKSFQHKLNNIRMDQNGEHQPQALAAQCVSSNSRTPPTKSPSKSPVKNLPPRIVSVTTIASSASTSSSVPFDSQQVDGVDRNANSVLDIKDESPIFNSTPTSQNVASIVQPNYVVVTAGTPSVGNYYLMQQNPPVSAVVQQNQFIQPTAFQVVPQPGVQPLQPVQTGVPQDGFYVQPNPSQNYIVQNTSNVMTTTDSQPAFIATTNAPTIYQQQQPVVQPTTGYVQYVAAPIQQPSPSQPRIINTMTLSPPRQINYRMRTPSNNPRMTGPAGTPGRAQNFPHPNGAVIRSNPLAPNVLRPYQRSHQPRAIAPRQQRQIAPKAAVQNTKSVQTNKKTTNTQGASKTTSLIVLSDSDDEIEMIIPANDSNAVSKPKTGSRSKPVQQQHQQQEEQQQQQSIPKKNVIPAELMQRMNEGGISICPIKPAQPAPSQNTQLVVVVNETGSHYALSLPNGSKLILTPEQVAQIRASNGGKLVL